MAFVTGGSGFVGRALLQRLKQDGINSVALVRSDAAAAAATANGATKTVRGDLHSVPAMTDGMRGCDVVYHCAAAVDDWGDRNHSIAVNQIGTRNVLAAARSAGVRRVVHVSTEALLATGAPIVNADETTPIPWGRHAGIYSETKALAESEVDKAVKEHGQDVVIVRPRFIWGHGDTTLLPRFVDAMSKGQWMWAEQGRFKSSTCHIDNCIEGMLLAAQKGRAGERYFLTDGPARSQRDIITTMVATQGVQASGPSVPAWVVFLYARCSELWARIFGGRPTVSYQAASLMFTEVTVNDAKARRELGYKGSVSVETGLVQLKQEAQQRGQ